MRSLVVAVAVAASAAVGGTGALAQTGPDAIGWLQRIYAATERLSYTGTFVYQHGGQVETSRITRVVDAGGVNERLETLDGTPREILRVNDQVTCYLPQTMTMKVERQLDARFPAMRAHPRELAENYHIRKAETERIAGRRLSGDRARAKGQPALRAQVVGGREHRHAREGQDVHRS